MDDGFHAVASSDAPSSRFAGTRMLAVVALGAPVPLCLMVGFWAVRGSFVEMFADLGASLPFPTALVLQRGWPMLLIAAYVLALPLPFVFRRAAARDFALLCVVIGGLLAVMASAAALHLPLVQISQAVSSPAG